MPSLIIKQLQLRRRGRGRGEPSDAPSPDRRDLSPGAAPDAAGRDRLAQHDGASKEQAHQAAHDQILEGLESLSQDYPEAQDLLQKFDQMWTRWMSGGQDQAHPSEPGPGDGEAPAPEGEAGSGVQALARKFGPVE